MNINPSGFDPRDWAKGAAWITGEQISVSGGMYGL